MESRHSKENEALHLLLLIGHNCASKAFIGATMKKFGFDGFSTDDPSTDVIFHWVNMVADKFHSSPPEQQARFLAIAGEDLIPFIVKYLEIAN